MYTSRYLKICVSLILGILFISACGGGSESSSDVALQEAQLAATQVAIEATQAALSAPTEAEPTEAPPPTAEPVEEPSNDQADSINSGGDEPEAFYFEDFDTDTVGLWTYYVMNGNEVNLNIYTDNSRLVFEINEDNLWSYFTYDPYLYTDVRLFMYVESLVTRNYDNTLVCRVSNRGWYEVSVSNNGLYYIAKYDAVDDIFVNLFNGGSTNINTGKATNEYGMICQGNSIGVIINGVLEKVVEDDFHKEGQIGIGVGSFDAVPIIAEIDYVSIEPIQ